MAAAHGKYEIIEYIKSLGHNDFGCAFIIAANHGQTYIVKYLLLITKFDKIEYDTAIFGAQDGGHDEIARILNYYYYGVL